MNTIATFFCKWGDHYVKTLTAFMGTVQYTNAIKNFVVQYPAGYVKCNDRTVFKWKWNE